MFTNRIFSLAVAFPAFATVLAGAGCNPHVTVDPVTINLNARLDITLHNAQDNLEQINGEKPINKIRPEDLGLPAPSTQPGQKGAAQPSESAEATYPVLLLRPGARMPSANVPIAATMPAANVDALKKSMAGRSAEILTLWNNKLVGETHTGLLVAKGTLTADQQKTVDAENADRTALYAADAAAQKITTDEVALQYFIARMGYAKNGAWYEKRNPAGQWEWKQWGM